MTDASLLTGPGNAAWLWVAGLLGLLAAGVLASWLLPGFAAGVWSPAPRAVVERMLELADPRPGEHLVDLGYGDGRVLLAAARRYRVRATGYDINPLWRFWVGLRAQLAGVADRVELRHADLFTADLSDADIVVAFLSQAAHDRLAPRLREALRPGARVVTYQRTLPGWQPVVSERVVGDKRVYLYRR